MTRYIRERTLTLTQFIPLPLYVPSWYRFTKTLISFVVFSRESDVSTANAFLVFWSDLGEQELPGPSNLSAPP